MDPKVEEIADRTLENIQHLLLFMSIGLTDVVTVGGIQVLVTQYVDGWMDGWMDGFLFLLVFSMRYAIIVTATVRYAATIII